MASSTSHPRLRQPPPRAAFNLSPRASTSQVQAPCTLHPQPPGVSGLGLLHPTIMVDIQMGHPTSAPVARCSFCSRSVPAGPGSTYGVWIGLLDIIIAMGRFTTATVRYLQHRFCRIAAEVAVYWNSDLCADSAGRADGNYSLRTCSGTSSTVSGVISPISVIRRAETHCTCRQARIPRYDPASHLQEPRTRPTGNRAVPQSRRPTQSSPMNKRATTYRETFTGVGEIIVLVLRLG